MVLFTVKQTTFLVALSMLLTISQAVHHVVDDADNEEDIKRSMLWSRLLEASNMLKNRLAAGMDETGSLRRSFSGIPFSEQKRYRPSVQSRSGGAMSLCLWKVCPAAPWLVSKRDNSADY